MTSHELRRKLCGNSSRFTLPLSVLKDRIGPPDRIHRMSPGLVRAGGEMVQLTYRTDDGEVELFCPIGFINQEEAVLEGWFSFTADRGEGADPGRQPAAPGPDDACSAAPAPDSDSPGPTSTPAPPPPSTSSSPLKRMSARPRRPVGLPPQQLPLFPPREPPA